MNNTSKIALMFISLLNITGRLSFILFKQVVMYKEIDRWHTCLPEMYMD